jgi:hypothetical protein
MMPKHLLVAKVIVVLAIGMVMGYAMGVSFAHDVTKAQTITKEAYVADFDRYKSDLESSDIPMAGTVVMGTVFAAGVFGIYELVSMGLAIGFRSLRGDQTDERSLFDDG